jgi:hypothetical protein
MREFDTIPQEEFDERKRNMNKLIKEPFLLVLQEKLRVLVQNPVNNNLESGETKFSMKPEVKKNFDRLNFEISLFKKVKYPELMIDIQENEKLERVKTLQKDSDYLHLISGIDYYTLELDSDENAINEIVKISKQIEELIERKFPDINN